MSRRKRRGYLLGEKGEITDQVWLVIELHPADEACSCPEPDLAPALNAAGAETFDEQLRDAVAESVADSVEQMFWEIDDLSDDQLARLVANLLDLVKSLVAEPLGRLASAAGAPAPAAAFGADVSAILLLKPVLEPLERAVHAFEVAGIVVGLVTGLHPLTVICAKHLAHDKLGSLVATGAEPFMTPAGDQEARRRLATVRSFADGNDSGTTTMPGPAASEPSPLTRMLVRAAQHGFLGAASVTDDVHQAKLPLAARVRLNNADDDDEAVNLSQAVSPLNAV